MSKRRQTRTATTDEHAVRASGVPNVVPKTPTQKTFLDALKTHQMVVVTGPAGTGKTFLSTFYAASLIDNRRISKIVLSRPNIPCGKSLGFFPGTLEEKMAPWVVPFTSNLEIFLGKARVELMMKRGDIEIVPFETMRGRSFDNAFVILDEAQNTTPEEIRMFLTRIGENTKVILNGDMSQSDTRGSSGLVVASEMIDKYKIADACIVRFTLRDIVRSDLCASWVRAFALESGYASV